MIQLISSYFFEERKHLNSFYVRETDHTEEFWTQASVKGKRMVDVPIYVLTSARTFSAAEEFTYNLKNMERATIIGQTTGGGAHPVRTYEVTDYPVRVSLPFGRAINPITGTNWEGTGIEPDIKVPANQALATAHLEALETLETSAEDDATRHPLTIARLRLETELHPIKLTTDALLAFVGSYGPRSITLEGSALFYSRGGRSPSAMLPAGEDRFFIEDNQGFYFHFERNPSGKIVRIVGNYSNGRSDQHERTGD